MKVLHPLEQGWVGQEPLVHGVIPQAPAVRNGAFRPPITLVLR